MGSLGWPEIAIIGLVVLVLFGPNRLPQFGRSLGKGLREFKSAIAGFGEESSRAPAGSGRFCSSCGAALEAEAKFCAQCGVKAGEPAGTAKT